MFMDASAFTAMLTDEEDAPFFYGRMEIHPRRITSAMAIWETTLAVARRLTLDIIDSEKAVEAFLKTFGVEVMPIPAEARHEAISAFARFGKGRHSAALNFGDCFAYACARHARVPLLYKGDDFSKTDIEAA